MKKSINIVVLGAIVKDDTFLLTKRVHLAIDPKDRKHYHNAWQIPGGGLEFGETTEQTLHREIKEETNLEVKIIKLLPKIYTEITSNWHGIFIVFICKLLKENQTIKLNDEASEYAWLTLNQARKLSCLPGTTEVLIDALLS